jgi:hypothetical protein
MNLAYLHTQRESSSKTSANQEEEEVVQRRRRREYFDEVVEEIPCPLHVSDLHELTKMKLSIVHHLKRIILSYSFMIVIVIIINMKT